MTPGIHICAPCKHMRTRAKIALFDAQDLQSAGALKAQIEWNQEQKQRAQLELQRFQARQPFDYEPHHYAWCAKFSKEETVKKAQGGDAAALDELMTGGGASLNPVTGEITPLYHLCAWLNANGDCAEYDPK